MNSHIIERGVLPTRTSISDHRRSDCVSQTPERSRRWKPEASVRQAILLLLSTRPGERVMRPTYGCDLHRLVFSPNDDTTAGLAIHYVRQALERWEPRIEVIRLDAGREAPLRTAGRSGYGTAANGYGAFGDLSRLPFKSHPADREFDLPVCPHGRTKLMALPSPNLDDRTFDQLVEESRQLIC